MFKSLILERPNDQIPPIMKLQYLKQALDGDALRTIQSVPMTAGALKRAWDALLSKYDNIERLKREYIMDLNNLKPIHEPSAHKLRQLFDQLNENREVLSILGEKVDHWDSILITNLTRCFDSDSQTFFELMVRQAQPKQIKWKDVAEFINMRCTCLDNSKAGSSRSNQDLKQSRHEPHRRSAAHHTSSSSQTECGVCNKNHPTYKCEN